MKLKLFFSITIIAIWSCTQRSGNDNEIKDSTSVNDSNVERKEVKEEKDTSVTVTFKDYQKPGLILQGNYKTYSEQIKVIGKINVPEIKALQIIQISETKHPQHTNVDYCKWANYLKVVYNEDTLILFGEKVLEINEEYSNINLKTKNVKLLIAGNFLTKSSDEEGLTGCDEYSYLIIENKNGFYSLVNAPKRDNYYPYEYAVLFDNDGIGEEITNLETNEDTIKLKIDVIYQEGSGSYNYKIYPSSTQWKSFETDRITKYD